MTQSEHAKARAALATANRPATQPTDTNPTRARALARARHERDHPMNAYREVWTDAPAPGGFICSVCGGPVESEPCPEHAPATEGEAHWLTRYDEDGEPYGEVCRCEHGEDHDESETRAVADAVVAAGPDADECDPWGLPCPAHGDKHWRDEVTRLRAEVERLGSLSEAYREHLEATTADWRHERLRAEAAEAERDRLAEVVARVEALAAHLDALAPGDRHYAARIQVALSGPTPAETPQNGPEPALSREHGTSGQSGEGEALRGAERCHGDRDGDCSWSGCPQLRDGEPVATGRHCPLDTREEGR